MGANEGETTPVVGARLRNPKRRNAWALTPKDGRVAAAVEIGRTVFGRQRKRPLRNVK